MPAFLCLLLFLSQLHWLDLSIFPASIANNLQSLCTSAIPENLQNQMIFQSLLCGKSLKYSHHYSSLRQLGLIHLFVVSGLHINFASFFFHRVCRLKGFVSYGFILFYALCTGLNPPALRALVHYSIKPLAPLYFWNQSQLLLACGTLILFLFPELWQSQSLQLSWLVTLVFCLPLKNQLQLNAAIFFFSFPIIAQWNPDLSLFSIISNFLMTPLIAYILFPSSFLAFLPPLSFLPDWLWSLFFQLTSYLKLPPLNIAPFQLSTQWVWFFIFSFHLVIIYGEICWRRKSF